MAYDRLQTGGSSFARDPNASVPCQNPSLFPRGGFDDGLHTPCQDVPMTPPMRGGESRPGRGEWTAGYRWMDMSRMLGTGRGSWNEPAYFDPTRPHEMMLGFSRDDVEYAKLSERKNREVVAKMGERQRRLLKALDGGRIFRLSKLKLEKNT